jgi:acetoin:2,6-dichlorophenolindophenol oxidoreductase subunit beta
VVLVDQGTRHASVSAIVASEIAEQRFSALAAPIAQVTARDSTIPYSEPLEAYVIPDVERITSAVRSVLKR